MELSDLKVSDRIEMAPHTDTWMFGDRFGEVVKIGRTRVHVKLDTSGRTKPFHPSHIGKIVVRDGHSY